uniref:Angiotensin II receptor associated protein n=1 Tax=Pavo cristatus TaxID=9049 RepID=A0A8C9L7H0_PAVCR
IWAPVSSLEVKRVVYHGRIGFLASYAWGNFSVLAVGIWAIVQRDSLDAIVMFLAGLLLTVLTDIIHISVYYPLHGYLIDVKRFSMGMAIFSLLLKPGSCYFVYRMYRERGGEYIFNIGRMLPLHQRGPRPLMLGKAARGDFVPFSLSLVQLGSAPLSKEEDGLSSSCLFSLCAPAES